MGRSGACGSSRQGFSTKFPCSPSCVMWESNTELTNLCIAAEKTFPGRHQARLQRLLRHDIARELRDREPRLLQEGRKARIPSYGSESFVKAEALKRKKHTYYKEASDLIKWMIITYPGLTVNVFSCTRKERRKPNFHEFRRKKWSDMRTLIVVHSSPSQGDFRTAIRETWGGREGYEAVKVRPLFFLGRSTDPEGESRSG